MDEYVDFLRLIDLSLRRFMFHVYYFIVPFVSRTKITKIRIGKKTLGQRIYSLFSKVLFCKLPEPIKVNGMLMYHQTLDKRRWFGWFYAFDYEPETRNSFVKILKSGMTVVDVGANIGYYTLLAAGLVGNKGRVYAFEPDPNYYTLLKKNIEVNYLNRIVESFKMAVGDTEKETILFLSQDMGSGLFKAPDTARHTVSVDLVSLDKFFANRSWPPVHIVKIDAEGADKLVLEGMRELVNKNRNIKIIIELNAFYLEAAGTTVEELISLIGEFGFNRIGVLSGRPRFYRIPNDIQYLVNLGQQLRCVNLLCERM